MTQSEQKQKTVRVRIAVAMNEEGQWQASGWHGAEDEMMENAIRHCMADAEWPAGVIRYVEAEVPLPHRHAVEGVTVPDENQPQQGGGDEKA